MNKYIKKCLMIYISMAIVLCGMVGVTYAITATDADNYVTRSQYAVDMAHLQNKLDEKEAGLLGTINRFRSTDVKFVTFDTPTKQATSTIYNTGYHTGGNFFPRYSITANSQGAWGWYTGNRQTEKKNGIYTNYEMYRLWNGNYILTPAYFYSDDGSNAQYYYPTVNYAVPIESHPGWYLEVKLYMLFYNATCVLASVVKLDPNASGPKPDTGTAVVRFKKELFRYCGTNVSQLTTTKQTAAVGCNVFRNTSYNAPLAHQYANTAVQAVSFTQTIQFTSYIDSETGDYMMEFSNFPIATMSADLSTMYNQTIQCTSGAPTMNKIIPNDNVEYVCGNTKGSAIETGYASYNCPEAASIGTGMRGDKYWQYEFVDGVNGIKYWHAYRPPAVSVPTGATILNPVPFGIHFSLPIVY